MKKLTAEQLEAAAWAAELSAPSVAAETVPPGWTTIAELAEQHKRDRSTVTHRIRDLVRAGKAEAKRFRIVTGRGVYPVPHYRLVAK